jgi:hypothetical protein
MAGWYLAAASRWWGVVASFLFSSTGIVADVALEFGGGSPAVSHGFDEPLSLSGLECGALLVSSRLGCRRQVWGSTISGRDTRGFCLVQSH